MAGNEYDPAAEINFDTLHLESLSYNIAYDIIRVEYKVGKVKSFLIHCLLINISDVYNDFRLTTNARLSDHSLGNHLRKSKHASKNTMPKQRIWRRNVLKAR